MALQELANDGKLGHYKRAIAKPLICFATFQTPFSLFFIGFFTQFFR
jgi:hypothetical protein